MHLLTPPFLPRIAVFCHFKVLMEKGVTEQVGGILPTLHLGEHLAFAAEGTEKRSSFLLSRWETDNLLAKTLLHHRMRLPSTVNMQ